MDWIDRDVRPGQSASQDGGLSSEPTRKNVRHKRGSIGGVARLAATIFLFSAVILVSATLIYLAIGGRVNDESQYVDTKKMQAVFLNGGQVYFGDITSLNNKYMAMTNIYYLRANEQAQDSTADAATKSNVQLIKLGCELHGPTDQMVINKDQIMFWENIKNDGILVKKVAEYVKQNPNGQNCEQSDTSSSTTQSQSQGTGTTTPATPTTPSTDR